MGILTLLRNAFGRSRQGRDADAETSPTEATAPTVPAPATEPEPTPAPAQEAEPKIPAPSSEPSVVDELVSAAFDNVTVPKPAEPVRAEKTTEATEEEAETGPTPTAASASASIPSPAPDPEPVSAAEAETEVAAEPEAEPVAEPVAETEVEAEAEVPAEPEVEAEAKAEAEAVVEAPAPEPEPVAETPEVSSASEPEPTAEEAPEPVAEEVSEPEPEPVTEEAPAPAAEETPEPIAAEAAEPVAEEEPSEPVSEETPAPVTAEITPTEPTTEPVTEPVAEPVTEPVTEPVAASADEPTADSDNVPADEPVAADGDQPPAGPPAPDDESVTGGAGGEEDPAEGEAEAGTTGTPATPLTHVKTHAPDLATAYQEAGTALAKRDLTGTRAKVYLVLDRSASMRPYYKDGSAQALGEQALALAAHLDPEAKVQVVFFSTELDGTGELTLSEHENKIDDLHAGLGRMGRTSYHIAVEEVVTHHQKSGTTDPALVIFQTDGAPDAKTPATQSLTDAAKDHPSVFFSFVAFGEQDNKAFDYLRKLKTDNTAFFHAGPTPRELTDAEVYEGVLENWRP
ncbi:VWA domain-containing protein [Streptomyces mirabilis]|uniref:VWA domain-containing protein n=1 Tax=Streptomyces mirabilis TaxID=68239 RepID=UPI0036887A94